MNINDNCSKEYMVYLSKTSSSLPSQYDFINSYEEKKFSNQPQYNYINSYDEKKFCNQPHHRDLSQNIQNFNKKSNFSSKNERRINSSEKLPKKKQRFIGKRMTILKN